MAGLHFPITIVAAVAALTVSVAGCNRGGRDVPQRRATAVAAAQDTSRKQSDTAQSGGEVVGDSAAPAGGMWITDANALSLLGLMNSRISAAANRELQRYRSDNVRVFAEEMVHEHAAMQHSADSVAAMIRIAPVAPALAATVSLMMQEQIDLVQGGRGTALDRAFVRQQIASHELMSTYVEQLGAVAKRPEIQGLMSSMASRVRAHIERARGLEKLLAAGDSAAAVDSAAKDSLRAKRPSPNR